jgi:muramoyltetrapeptide carboxypeptidase
MRRIVTNERMRAVWAFLPAVVFGVLLHVVPVAAAVPDGSIVREELLKEYSREWIDANALSTRPEFKRALTPPVAEGVRALGAAKNGVRLYAVEYATRGVDGAPVVASGLVMIPLVSGPRPLVSYQQGMILDPLDSPSLLRSGEATAMLHVFAAYGYVVTMPDYIGQGRSLARHPFLHAATEASAGVHLLEAARRLCAKLGVQLSGKLFLTGLSQGGHATMAMHRLLESGGGAPVTASAPVSGPYRLLPCWKLWLRESDAFAPVVMAKTILSCAAVSRIPLNDVFLPGWERKADELLFGRKSGASRVRESFPPEQSSVFRAGFLRAMERGSHPICRLLALNDVDDWAPKAPVRLYYSTKDTLVPHEIALETQTRMKRLGAPVEAVDVGPVSHGGSFMPSLIASRTWFDSFLSCVPEAAATTATAPTVAACASRLPAPLGPGSRVAVIALASPSTSADIERSVKVLVEQFGYEPVLYPSTKESRGYLAGRSDEANAEELHRAFEDPKIDGIVCLRGGYGSQRLLRHLDPVRIAKHPKVFIGYSDITAVHSFLNGACGLVTFHGPMVIPSMRSLAGGDPRLAALFGWMRWMHRLLEVPDALPGPLPTVKALEKVVGGRARGPLAGGNLTMISTLMGTPWEIDLRGKILFIEDVGEKVYRIDRMLTQLRNSGKLDDLAGFILGDFVDCPSPEGSQTLDDAMRDILVPLGKPIAKGLHAGHGDINLALPFGVMTEMNADEGTIRFLEPALAR